MYMHFKQRFFFPGLTAMIFTVKTMRYCIRLRVSFHGVTALKVFDAYGRHVAMLKEQVFTFLPKFDIYIGDEYVGFIKKEFTFLNRPYDGL